MDALDYARFAFALIAVIGLIGLAALAARRMGFAPGAPQRGVTRRLQVVETLALDARRRIVLIRRDGQEHLLLLGGDRETVIEAGLDAPAVPFPDAGEAVAPGAGEALARQRDAFAGLDARQ